MKTIVKSLQDFKVLASDFAKRIKNGDVVLLFGDLGAGKTTFTQFVFSELGVNDVVNSPTFAILKSYKGKFNFHHFDTYRISVEEAVEAGFDEVLNDKDSVIFIEWSENIQPLLPDNTVSVNIKYIDENTREVEILDEKINN